MMLGRLQQDGRIQKSLNEPSKFCHIANLNKYFNKNLSVL